MAQWSSAHSPIHFTPHQYTNILIHTLDTSPLYPLYSSSVYKPPYSHSRYISTLLLISIQTSLFTLQINLHSTPHQYTNIFIHTLDTSPFYPLYSSSVYKHPYSHSRYISTLPTLLLISIQTSLFTLQKHLHSTHSTPHQYTNLLIHTLETSPLYSSSVYKHPYSHSRYISTLLLISIQTSLFTLQIHLHSTHHQYTNILIHTLETYSLQIHRQLIPLFKIFISYFN